jgi:hypothetical protein
MARKHIETLVTIVNFYIFPIFFGFIGALIFAIRELLDNRNNALNIGIVLGYYLRACLGGILGLIIGYVNIPTIPSGISATPLLLSLVAGFSVDAVISILERIASALKYENYRTN